MIENLINTILNSLGVWGPVSGCILIVLESIIPILPLFVFITFNFLSFGKFIGFIISWIFTCLGCFLSFYLFRKNIRVRMSKKLKNKGIISKKTIEKITNLKLEELTMLIAIPFTPAFLVNIACALSKMSFKKFLVSIIIGKIFLVYFWGFIGVSLIESFKHPIYLVKIFIMLIISLIISKIIKKKLNIN